MIHIHFDEPTTQKWQDWRKQCDEEQKNHNKAIEAGGPSKVKDDVYKGKNHNIKKDVFINTAAPFYGKCAFCEQNIYRNQHGDIEHFRPKAGVKDENNKPIQIEVNGKTIDHPGYYWLAYDWKNLLPSCELCNRPSSEHSEGPIGKRNYFPVKGSHAFRPGEEKQEKPLLLHPVFCDPKDHLQVDETGVMVYLTDEGCACIKIFGLNERDLINARKEKYSEVHDKVKLLLLELRTAPSISVAAKLKKVIHDIKQGAYVHCAAPRKAIEDTREAIEDTLEAVQDARDAIESMWSDQESKD